MSYEFFYPGTPYALEPSSDLSTGYTMSASQIGMASDPRTANQIQEISNKLNIGTKTFEVGSVSPRVFESIPKQQLKEINRLAKLTGMETTVHAPLIEASGYTNQGWSEADRRSAEAQMFQAVERSQEINPNGNVPVTFHSSGTTEFGLPQGEERIKEKFEGKEREVVKSVIAADPRTGRIQEIRETEKFFPEGEVPEKYKEQYDKGQRFIPGWEIDKKNKETWERVINDINFQALRGAELVDGTLRDSEQELKKMGVPQEKIDEQEKVMFQAYKSGDLDKLPEALKQATVNFRQLTHADIFLRDSYNNIKELYNQVYKDANEDDKQKLKSYAEQVSGFLKQGTIEEHPERMKDFAGIIEKGVKVLSNIKNPQLFKPLNEFLIDKSAETFSNIAFKAYEKFGDKAPVIAIENPPAGGALSRADELKKLIEESRKKFVKQAVEEGISQSKAEDTAKKLIGATWDVGHINMIRKFGYGKEDLLKEAEKIAPYVKKVHLSDNFGFEHTELPMGMGNVPIKEIMEKLGKEGFDAKKIIEAGDWWQHFKTAPFTQSLEAFGSPLYAMKAPYWNQISSTYGNYMALPSAYFPEQHFSMYGGGFSTLPAELGGQMPGKQSRMTGTSME